METKSTDHIDHFLLVEDDNDHAELVQMAFDHNNIANTMDRVADGQSAMDYLNQCGEFSDSPRPNLIILDLNLPKINGHQVLNWIKQDENFKSIPVVVMTTSASDADKNRAYANNVNSFLTKPLDFEKFMRMIQDLNMYWTVWNQGN